METKPFHLSEHPSGIFTNPLLNDKYQLTMVYAYWKAQRQDEFAVFDLFFRRNPFKGEYTVFAGLSECVRYLKEFRFSDAHLQYIDKVLENPEPEFISYLKEMTMERVSVTSIDEGSIVFPRVPLMRIEGPLANIQLLETTFLNLVNFASLMCTNATRYRLRAGSDKKMIEFGLRRAQGPNGAMSASRYSYMGGFDGTSNLQGGFHYDIPVHGTHAHSFVQSFVGLSSLKTTVLKAKNCSEEREFVSEVLTVRKTLGYESTNEGELAAFIAYAQGYPDGFLALVDTYDTLNSGVPNFLAVAAALKSFGYTARGIRLDSGDLSFLSKAARALFESVGRRVNMDVSEFKITASNDINEKTLISLNEQGHSIDVFGIGTHLVTCQAQPALGCVFKLVEIDHAPRIKLSQDIGKVTIPGRKRAFRLIGARGQPLLDLLQICGEEEPRPGKRILCRHPFDEAKRAYVVPTEVIPLHKVVWGSDSVYEEPSMLMLKERVSKSLSQMRADHLRYLNPTPYKVAVSEKLYSFIHSLWMSEAPIPEMS